MARKTAKGPAAGSDPVVEGIPEDAGPEDATAPLPKEKPLGSSKAVETMFRNATRAELELIALAARNVIRWIPWPSSSSGNPRLS